ncbi:MAG TPA: methyltransferase domain-containing protein [Thermoleophilaceae bacterium]|jgi:SAM-dependent methyltransferase
MGNVEQLWDLHNLAEAHRLVEWTSEHVLAHAHGTVAEVGAGIGTYSERMLANGADPLLLLEPDEACLGVLHSRFNEDPRVVIAEETVPDSPSLKSRAGQLDAVVSQNVIEHIEDDRAAVRAMAEALRPGGVLSLQVPAHPALYGELDRVYGHYRRYTRRALREVVEGAGLEVVEIRPFNLLGVLGWAVNRNRSEPRVSAAALRVFETLVKPWRPVEERLRPRWGLSLLAHARRPG